MIQGLKLLANQGGPRIAIVVGGPGWQKILQKLKAAGIKVFWRRFLTRSEDGAPMYRALDFYWVTSQIEGAPVPLLEAMSSGVCCLSTKVGVAPEVIRDGENGYLIEIGDAFRFASITADLIAQPDRRIRMGRKARSTIVSGYDWSRTATYADTLYQTAIGKFEQRYRSSTKSKGYKRKCTVKPPSDSVDKRTLAINNAILLPKYAKWLEDQEKLIWTRELCRMGETCHAVRFGLRTCICNPFKLATWSVLANLVFPRSLLHLKKAKPMKGEKL